MKWIVKTQSPWNDLKPMKNGIKKYHRMFWSNPEDVKKINTNESRY